ncbi:hypothetical protein BSAF29S_00064 [Bacillus safensis subsp. safensis]
MQKHSSQETLELFSVSGAKLEALASNKDKIEDVVA